MVLNYEAEISSKGYNIEMNFLNVFIKFPASIFSSHKNNGFILKTIKFAPNYLNLESCKKDKVLQDQKPSEMRQKV